jgi:hypothetical protein
MDRTGSGCGGNKEGFSMKYWRQLAVGSWQLNGNSCLNDCFELWQHITVSMKTGRSDRIRSVLLGYTGRFIYIGLSHKPNGKEARSNYSGRFQSVAPSVAEEV